MRGRKQDHLRERLTDAADVSRRTFFRHFGPKEDVLLAWIELRDDALHAVLDARPRGEPSLEQNAVARSW
ncbi:hypothetical protein tb265_19500 [Gemmatimonadetes bacterium T265]|nr:hypothetical protein tb265_19500 [Gemmatimonadetes bacterium T265]